MGRIEGLPLNEPKFGYATKPFLWYYSYLNIIKIGFSLAVYITLSTPIQTHHIIHVPILFWADWSPWRSNECVFINISSVVVINANLFLILLWMLHLWCKIFKIRSGFVPLSWSILQRCLFLCLFNWSIRQLWYFFYLWCINEIYPIFILTH